MSIEATCPKCGRQYRLADHLHGKTIRCKECQEAFRVEDPADSPAPRKKASNNPERSSGVQSGRRGPVARRDEREDDADERRPQRRRRYENEENDERERSRGGSGLSVPVVLAIVGGGVLVLILLVVAGGFLFWRSRAPSMPVAQNAGPSNPGPQQGAPFNPQANPGLRPNNPFPRGPGQHNAGPQQPVQPAPVAWTAQPDPGPDLAGAKVPSGAAIPLFGLPKLLFPTTPSSFAAILHGQLGQQSWQVIDLQRFQVVATVPGKPDLQHPALSPDGKYLAGKGQLTLEHTSLPVISTAEKRVVQTITLNTRAAALLLIDFLEGDRLLTFKTHGVTGIYEVFDIGTGQPVKQFTVPGLLQPKNNLALSPGRKYLAIAHDNQVDLYHASEGRQVGQLSLPPGSQGSFEGLAFSPDGKELACLRQQFGQGGSMVSWKMTDGEVAVQHTFAKDIKTLVHNAFGYEGQLVQWVPDGSGWLLYGTVWIDHASGGLLYQVPRDPHDFRSYPRCLLDKDHLVTAVPAGNGLQLAAVPLPAQEIAAAARKGPDAGNAPAALPAPTAASVAGAKMLAAPSGAAAWSARPDPASPPRRRLAAVQLTSKAPDIQHILFAAGDAAQAVVLASTTPDPLSTRRVIRAERYDLGGGRALGACSLFPTEAQKGAAFPHVAAPGSGNAATLQAALSPDGSRLAVRQATEAGRLDVWGLAEAKHVVGWKPFDGDAVEGFAFLDADRVLTSGKGKLILWKIPDCQAVYVAEGYRGTFALSPGRKLVAASTGTGLEVLDAASGERQGQLQAPADAGGVVVAAAFRPDGKELAAVLESPGGKKLAHWSLSSGELQGTTVFQGNNQPLSWAGTHHVLQGNTLHSVSFAAPIAIYTLPGPGLLAEGSPDGRCWFAAFFQNTSLLSAQSLPDDQARTLTAAVEGERAEAVKTYQLSINGPDKLRTAVQNSVEQHLQNQGWKQGTGGVTISISAQGGRTGQTLLFTEDNLGIAVRGGKKITVAEFQVTCRYSITDAQGTSLSKNEAAFKTPDHIMTRGDDYQTQLDEAVWNSATSWCSGALPPGNLYRFNGQIRPLPLVLPLVGRK